MGRRCEVQDARDVPYVVPGILGELRGRYQAHEINHALQIRRARLGEVAAQMLAAQADRLGELLRRHRPPGVRDYHFPGAALKLSGEAEGLRWLAECVTEPRRESVWSHQVPRRVVVDSIDDEVDESERSAACRARSIRRPQRHDREEWSAWKFRRERGCLPGILVGRSQIDEGSVDEHSAENCLELVSGPRRDDLPPPPGKSPTHERASPLSLQMDYQRWQRRSVGSGWHAQTPASTVSRSGLPSMNCRTIGSFVC